MQTTQTIDYPSLSFEIYLNKNYRSRVNGYAIKDWLLVGWADNRYDRIRLYNCFGYRVTTLEFTSWHDAIKMAEFIDTHYGDYYFHLWMDDPKANVIQLTQYTVEDGETLHNLLQLKHENTIVTYEQVMGEYEQLRFSR